MGVSSFGAEEQRSEPQIRASVTTEGPPDRQLPLSQVLRGSDMRSGFGTNPKP